MDEERLSNEVRNYVSKNDQRLYHALREEYQRWLMSNVGTFLDFVLWLASTHERFEPNSD